MRWIRTINVRDSQIAVFRQTEDNIPMVVVFTIVKNVRCELIARFDNESNRDKFFDAFGISGDEYLKTYDALLKIYDKKLENDIRKTLSGELMIDKGRNIILPGR